MNKIDKKRAATLLMRLQAEPLSFLIKNFYALLLNNLYADVLPNSFGKKDGRQLLQLIEQTGFAFFRQHLLPEEEHHDSLMEIKGKKII